MPKPDGPQFLPASEFINRYKVAGQYDEGRTWDDIEDDESYWEGAGHVVAPIGEINANDLEALEKDITKRGIQNPVRVRGDIVVNGHHRVNIARKLSDQFPIPYMDDL